MSSIQSIGHPDTGICLPIQLSFRKGKETSSTIRGNPETFKENDMRLKTKNQVFEELLNNYVSLTMRYAKIPIDECTRVAIDMTDAWRKLYQDAEDNINGQLKNRI